MINLIISTCVFWGFVNVLHGRVGGVVVTNELTIPQTVRRVDRVTYTQRDRDRNDFTRKTIRFFPTIYRADWHFTKLTVLQTRAQSNVGMTTVMIPVTKLRQQLLRTSDVITALRVASVMSLPVTWCKRLLLHNDQFTANFACPH